MRHSGGPDSFGYVFIDSNEPDGPQFDYINFDGEIITDMGDDDYRGPIQLPFEFLYYGEYDLRLERAGFEPIMTTRWAVSPIWEAPVVDLFAELLSPNRESLVQWHFELEPRNDDPELLLDRAKTLRGVSQERHGE